MQYASAKTAQLIEISRNNNILTLQNVGCFVLPAENVRFSRMVKLSVFVLPSVRRNTNQFVEQMGIYMAVTVNCTELHV